MRYFSYVLLTLMVLTAAADASAQTASTLQTQAQTHIEIKPSRPAPFTNISLSLVAYSFDPSRTVITWYINGKEVGKGVGMRNFTTTTGAAGKAITVQAVAEPTNRPKSVTTVVVRPAYVAIVWEAQTYTPVFYKGKAMATPGAAVTYIALPFFVDDKGNPIDPSKLYYIWKRRYLADQNASGLGKRTYTVQQDYRNADISVEVITSDKAISYETNATVPRIQPILNVYALHPLLGIRYEHAIGGTYALSSEESSLIVEPYFFSILNRNAGNVAYDWTIDGTPSSNNSSIVLRTTGDGVGTANITLLARHLSELLQSTRKTMKVQYGTKQQNEVPASTQQQDTYAPF